MFANTQSKKRERETLGLDSIERSVKSFTLELFSSEAKRVIFKFFVYISKRDNSKVGKKKRLPSLEELRICFGLTTPSIARASFHSNKNVWKESADVMTRICIVKWWPFSNQSWTKGKSYSFISSHCTADLIALLRFQMQKITKCCWNRRLDGAVCIAVWKIREP